MKGRTLVVDDEIPREPLPEDPEYAFLQRARRSEQEYLRLTSESRLRNYVEADIVQKIWIKWIAVFTGVSVSGFMAFVLIDAISKITTMSPYSAVPSAALSTVIVAGPIISITTITGSLFLAAFRGLDKGDVKKTAKETVKNAMKVADTLSE